MQEQHLESVLHERQYFLDGSGVAVLLTFQGPLRLRDRWHDQDKTRLSHLMRWGKDVDGGQVKKSLMQCHLTCFKYNGGSQLDEVYTTLFCAFS